MQDGKLHYEILSVEDSFGDQRLIREFLKSSELDFTLHFVSDGAEALEYLRGDGKFSEAPAPNLILLDLNLPCLNGRELLRQLKSNPRYMHIPVVVFTTSSNEDDVWSSYRLHANSYFTKPADVDEYAQVLRRITEHWLQSATLPPARPGNHPSTRAGNCSAA